MQSVPSRFSLHVIDALLNSSQNSDEDILRGAWRFVGPWLEGSRGRLLEEIRDAYTLGIAETELKNMGRLMTLGRVRAMAVRKDTLQRGRVNWETGEVILRGWHEHRAMDCVIDDMAEHCIVSGGYVVSCAAHEMPAGVNAIALKDPVIRSGPVRNNLFALARTRQAKVSEKLGVENL